LASIFSFLVFYNSAHQALFQEKNEQKDKISHRHFKAVFLCLNDKRGGEALAEQGTKKQKDEHEENQ